MNASSSSNPEHPQNAYDSVFWCTYAANTMLMVAVSVLFRYSDFVQQAGGNALQLGLIVGLGTIGALAMRIFQGTGIDRFGPRLVWLLSLALFVGSMAGHVLITSVAGPAVYLMRFLMMTSLAGAFGASITFISLRVPEARMAEMIGMLGSSGFVGMATGPVVGDLLFAGAEVTRVHVQRMFAVAAIAGIVSFACATLATRKPVRRSLRKQPSPLHLIRRYHPGVMLLVAAAMGIGIGLPGIFLRPYTKELGIDGIRVYFLVYAATAFTVRISTRSLPTRLGIRPLILAGFLSLAASMLMYLFVQAEWQLAIPAIFAGMAHAFLFPSVVSGGSLTFPPRYRGLATTLILAMFDVGNLVGQPAVGGILELTENWNLPSYPIMFMSLACALVTVVIVYGVATWNSPVTRRVRRRGGTTMQMATLATPQGVAVTDLHARVVPSESAESLASASNASNAD